MLWRVVPFEPLDEPPRLFGREGFVERRGLVGAEIVLHEDDPAGVWKVRVGQLPEDMGVIGRRVAIGDLDVSPALERREHMNRLATPLRSYS